MPADLKTIAKHSHLVDGAYSVIMGAEPIPAHLDELLNQCWPDCYKSEYTQKTIMAPADAERLEKLFELFGVPMRVADNSIEVLGRAYDIFIIWGLKDPVEYRLRFPKGIPGGGVFNLPKGTASTLSDYLHDWPPEWVAYIEAVATENKAEARRLAHKLQVLAPGCEYPPGVYVKPLTAP